MGGGVLGLEVIKGIVIFVFKNMKECYMYKICISFFCILVIFVSDFF